MDVIFPSCAGLDVHKRSVMDCRITLDPTGQQADGLVELKEFTMLIHDLLALSDWLVEAGVTPVATDIMGVSGRAILQALIVRRADPATMAALAKGRLRSKLPLLEQALRGLVRDHHRRLLALQLAHIDFLDEQIEALSTEITRCLTDLSAEDAPAQPAAPTEVVESQPELSPPGTPLTFTRAIALLDTIPGIDRRGAERWVADTGIDMARFGTAARLAARRRRKRAIIAVAHSRVVGAFHMLSCQEPYQELGAYYFDEQQRHHMVDRLTRRTEQLGYHVRLEPLPTTGA
jgi:transposase